MNGDSFNHIIIDGARYEEKRSKPCTKANKKNEHKGHPWQAGESTGTIIICEWVAAGYAIVCSWGNRKAIPLTGSAHTVTVP